jgi:hypothetical protein
VKDGTCNTPFTNDNMHKIEAGRNERNTPHMRETLWMDTAKLSDGVRQ